MSLRSETETMPTAAPPPVPVLTGNPVLSKEEQRRLERPGTIALLVSAFGTMFSCLPTMAAALFYSGLWQDEARYMATAEVLEPLRPVALGIQALGCFLGTRGRSSRQGRLAILLPVASWAAVIVIYYTRWVYTSRL